MKRALLIFFSYWCCAVVSAQVQLQSLLPSGGLVQKNQLWNIIAVNVSGGELPARVEIVLRDRVTGLDLLSGVSTTITLARGATSLNFSKVSPVQYNYMGLPPGNEIQSLLPVGQYIVCYSLDIAGQKSGVIRECVDFDVEALGPPQLLFPADSSQLTLAPGYFSWTPPTPAQLFSQLNYELVLTEILPGQKAAQAVAENVPVIAAGNIAANMLSYPLGAASLVPGKWYAWQVTARDLKQYAGKSEAGVFTIDSIKAENENGLSAQFITLTGIREMAGTIDLKEKTVLAYYYSFGSAYETDIIIRDEQQEIVRKKVTVQAGENYLSLGIIQQLVTGKLYTISITDLSGKEYRGNFQLIK